LDWVNAMLPSWRNASGEINMVVPMMPMVPSATATGVRVAISAMSARMKTRNPRNDCMRVRSPSLLVGGCVAGFRRRHRPGTDKLHAAGQKELERPDRADPVEVFE